MAFDQCGQGIPQPILSQRLLLRPMDSWDVPRLVDMAGDWDVTRYTTLPFPYDLRRASTLLQQAAGDIVVMLERLRDGQVVGCIIARPDGTGGHEVSYWLGRSHWGQGYGTEAVRRFYRHLFLERSVEWAWTPVNPNNEASVHVVAHLGMQAMGQTPVAYPDEPQPRQLPKYGITKGQWQRAHANRPKVLVSAAALIDPDGRVLMACRPDDKPMAGLWEFPGGKVHSDETPEQALVRELSEELGLQTGVGCMAPIAFASHDYDSFHLLMPLYAIRVWDGRPTPREAQELRWLRPGQMADLPMPPADIPLVAMVREWL